MGETAQQRQGKEKKMFQVAVAVIGVVIASVCDMRMRKIPNWLTFTMIAAGFVLNSVENGSLGFQNSLFGFTLGVVLLYLPFTLGGVGGGDVKLLGGLGSLLGYSLIFKIFLASAVLGGIFSLYFAVQKKRTNEIFSDLRSKALLFYLTRKIVPEDPTASSNKLYIPYAYAISLGTLIVIFVLRG